MVDRAVFLDRDGVVNRVLYRNGRPASPRKLAEFQFECDIVAPLELLHVFDMRLFVVTNQPDIARGLLEPQTLAQINQQVLARLPIEAIEVCPHDDHDDCPCRKPRPGMLTKVAMLAGVDLGNSFVIGDSWRDVQAARAAGCTAILLDRPYNRDTDTDYRVSNIGEAARLILEYWHYE